MRKNSILSLLLLLSLATNAQIVYTAKFDTLILPGTDTAYINFSRPGTDVGFDIYPMHFPCVYDTTWGLNLWSSGFAYSNRTDSSGYPNLYSAQPLRGHDSSEKYAVVNGTNSYLKFTGGVHYATPKGFYITNSTYAYRSMKYGDAFARKFGDTSGTRPDWFKVTIKGYLGSVQVPDTVNFYLADFRNDTSSRDYIVKDWRYVDLSSINRAVDSLTFTLSSSDVGSFGMNTPAFFCIDDFSVNIFPDKVNTITAAIAKTYPNPATNELNLDILDKSINTAAIYNLSGQCLLQTAIHSDHTTISLTNLPAGIYTLHLSNGQQVGVSKFQKL